MLMRIKHYNWGLMLLITYMALCQIRYTNNFDNPVKEKMSSKILTSYEEKCELEKSGTDIGQIYLYDTEGGDGNWKIYSIAQFYFNRYTLQIGLPDYIKNNDIIISTIKIDEIEDMYKDILCYELDDNEVWYTYLQLNQ